MNRLLLILTLVCAFCSCGGERKSVSNKSTDKKEIVRYGLEVVASYPHDVHAYTQGLFFHDGLLHESVGEYGESDYRIYSDFKTGSYEEIYQYGKEYFLEGSVIFQDKLYVLTWTNAVVFVYDAKTHKKIQTIRYPRQGWGLTTDGKQLIASDGSSRLYFMDENMNVKRSGVVRKKNTPVSYLNELEYINGKIWANIYTTDNIVIIDPETLQVEGIVDCKGLLKDELKTPETDVLNGIAQNPADGKIYLTGKNWPLLFEVKLVQK